jgi:hypothetical protein
VNFQATSSPVQDGAFLLVADRVAIVGGTPVPRIWKSGRIAIKSLASALDQSAKDASMSGRVKDAATLGDIIVSAFPERCIFDFVLSC